jgi:uncharacterized membrane protein (UPF0127 family)
MNSNKTVSPMIHAEAQRRRGRRGILNYCFLNNSLNNSYNNSLRDLRASAPPREILWVLVLVIIVILSCNPRKLERREIPIERDGEGIAVVIAEIAVTPEERNKGLMYRKKLYDGEGMLFVFEKDDILSFWMKITYIPLSIAFIAYDGRILDIKDMHPHNEQSVMSNRSARYALEVPQGWFGRAGVRTGDIVKITGFRQ